MKRNYTVLEGAKELFRINLNLSEAYITASFIRKIVLEPKVCNEMTFVLSGFGLWDYAQGADIICFKENIVYVVEAKRGRTDNSIKQVLIYKEHLERDRFVDTYAKIFSEYLTSPIDKYTICPVALVPKRVREAENSFEIKCVDNSVLVWNYETINGEVEYTLS